MEVKNVNKELPKKHGHYLAYCPRSFPKNCRWVVAEYYIDGSSEGWYDEYDTPLEDVTHWCEIPKETELKD